MTDNYNVCYVFPVDNIYAQQSKTVFIAGDHGGFDLKSYLTHELIAKGYEVTDLGFPNYDANDDYPDLLTELSTVSQKSHIPTIVICRNGVGVCVLANKINGVRCALSFSPEHAKSARADDNANFLALPADYISKEVALQTALAFLETPFSNEERHTRRLKKLEEIKP